MASATSCSNDGPPHPRRNAMATMRRLARALARLLPQSSAYLADAGDRLTEEQVGRYFDMTLGDAPRPRWGQECESYLAVLLRWATGCNVTEEMAVELVERCPGGKAAEYRMSLWRLPLRLAAEPDAETPYVLVDLWTGPEPPRKRRAISISAMTEVDVWRVIHVMARAAVIKDSTAAPEMRGLVSAHRRKALEILTGPPPQHGAAGGQPPLLSEVTGRDTDEVLATST